MADNPRKRLEALIWGERPADLEQGWVGENLPEQIDRVAFGGRDGARTFDDLLARFGRRSREKEPEHGKERPPEGGAEPERD